MLIALLIEVMRRKGEASFEEECVWSALKAETTDRRVRGDWSAGFEELSDGRGVVQVLW